jgi:hypothetical protein
VGLKEVNVIFGQNSFGSIFSADNLTSTSGFKILDVQAQAVNNACDINGDGKADIIVDHKNGLAFVLFGQANFNTTYYNISSLTDAVGFSIVGGETNAQVSLTSGDINGDGKCDVIIGAAGQQNTLGSVYVIFGSTSWLPVFNVSSLNGVNGFRIDGATPGRTLGVSIATGDVNGDHIADLIIAESDSACISGSAYVIHGKADFSSDAAFNLNALDGTNGYKIINIPGCDSQGFTVSSGDVDGNGRDDVLIGSGAQVSGADAFVIFG